MKKIVALVPLRAGSKSIPHKNIKLMAGRPLCYWSIKAAVECPYISRVYVSTESTKIKKIVLSFGFDKVTIINRPKRLASDSASTESVMLHAAGLIDFNVMVTLQATSPLTQSQDLKSAIRLFEKRENDSMLSAVIIKRFFWNWDNRPMNYDPMNRPRRQEFKGTFMENGSFYITTRETLMKYKNRLGGNIGIYLMGDEHAIEIDEPKDWQVVEKMILAREIKPLMKDIALIITDFDGVLTDNRVFVNKNGDETVVCNRADGLAVNHFSKKGIKVVCLSTEVNKVVKKRCDKMGIQTYQGIENKIIYLKKILKENKIDKKRCLYIGNDINDLECLQYVGHPVIPSDANLLLKEFNFYTTHACGGSGVLREVYKLMFE